MKSELRPLLPYSDAAPVFADTCSGSCYRNYAIRSNYATAYFEVQYVRVYGNGLETVSAGNGSGSSSSAGNGSGIKSYTAARLGDWWSMSDGECLE